MIPVRNCPNRCDPFYLNQYQKWSRQVRSLYCLIINNLQDRKGVMESAVKIEEGLGIIRSKLEAKGRIIPRRLSELPTLPYKDFNKLKEMLLARRVLIQKFKFSYYGWLLRLVSSPWERFQSTFFMGMTYIGPIIAIVLCFSVSWWFLLAVIILPMKGMAWTKKHYTNQICCAALLSETIFSFLFYMGQISITSIDFKDNYYWKADDIQ